MMGVCAIVMVGMLGLTTDLGRVYVAKNELQAFVDAASLAAALKLDGKSSGLAAAQSTGQTGPVGIAGTVNSWSFSGETVPTPTVTCSQTFAGTYVSCPGAPVDSRFVRVLASVTVPMYFIPIVPGVAGAMTVNAQATAGLSLQNAIGNPAPFSPPARDPNDPHFGYTPGNVYSVKWPPGGQESTCGDDETFWGPSPPLGAPDRGIIDLGQGNGAPGVGEVLVDGAMFPGAWPHSDGYHVGDLIPLVPGGKTGPVDKAVEDRFMQDTNRTPGTYAEYIAAGNGNTRRLLLVPVNDTPSNLGQYDGYAHVIGFALFFLQNYDGKHDVCAEYVGPANLNSLYAGPSTAPTQYYSAQLLQ
jgi:Flp pilus assembly protein TadG